MLQTDVYFLNADEDMFDKYLHSLSDVDLCLELKSVQGALNAMDDFERKTNYVSTLFIFLSTYCDSICEELAERCCKSVLSALPAPNTD